MEIAGTTIAPDSFEQLSLDIARLPSRTKIDIPIFVRRAANPGPSLLLMAGLHGDEINGIEIVRNILAQDCFKPLQGTVVCVPIINIYGFLNFSREVPDGKDVNRSFPGARRGSLASRVAYHLMNDILPAVDFGIDFHTGGASRANYPQIRCLWDEPQNQSLAQAFNPPIIMDADLIPKSLRHAAHAKGKKILVYEGGESLRFDQHAIQEGIAGTKRLMQHLGMIELDATPKTKSLLINKRRWIRAKNAGLFHASIKNGQHVKKGAEIGFITDPFADFHTVIKAPFEGIIVALNHNPVVNRGDALAHIGQWSEL